LADSIPYYSDEGLEIAFWRNVMILDISGDMTMKRTLAMGAAYRTIIADHPEGMLCLSLMRAGVPVSSPEVRAESVRIVKELDDAILRLVAVIEDDGVFALTMRTALRGFNVQTRAAKLVIQPTVEEGMRAILPFVTNADACSDLAKEMRDVIAAHRRLASIASAPKLRQAR
jgi:hypothetical protein